MSNSYSPSSAASCLKAQNNATGPKDPGPPAKSVGRSQPQAGRGMGYNPAQAAKCLDYWDNPGAADKNGPQTIAGY